MTAAATHRGAVVVLLAAGEGRRYGGAKQLAEIGGEPMVRRAAKIALGAGAPLQAVTGAHAEAVEAALAGLPLHVVRHAGWHEGMGSSLAAGIREVQRRWPGASGALVCLADQPLLETAMLDRLLARHRDAPEAILATDLGDAAGPPALFPRDCFDTLARGSGARGAQALLRQQAARVETFAFGALPDVDTPADLQRVRQLLGAARRYE